VGPLLHPNDASKLSTATGNYRLAIYGNLECAGPVEGVSRFKVVRSLGDVRSLGYSVALDAEAACGLASHQPESSARLRGRVIILTSITTQSHKQRRDSAILVTGQDSPARFCRNVIILDLYHNPILETVPSSLLEPPLD
jgi:hypothetical protein